MPLRSHAALRRALSEVARRVPRRAGSAGAHCVTTATTPCDLRGIWRPPGWPSMVLAGSARPCRKGVLEWQNFEVRERSQKCGGAVASWRRCWQRWCWLTPPLCSRAPPGPCEGTWWRQCCRAWQRGCRAETRPQRDGSSTRPCAAGTPHPTEAPTRWTPRQFGRACGFACEH